ncbi:MAG: hypothetical protein R6X31_02030 [Anaerolineae bacterium]
MRRIVRKWIPIFIAVTACLLTLGGYMFPQTQLGEYRDQLIEWAVIIGAFAFVLGLFNIVMVHGKRASSLGKGWVYSLVLLVSALASWVPPLIEGPSGKMTDKMFEYVMAPLGASLAALLVFTLTLAAFRLLRTRRSPWSLLFIVVVTLTLLGSTPIAGIEWLSDIRSWLIGVPGMAGIRGLLLGVALGTVITGLRVLLVHDRPYSEY